MAEQPAVLDGLLRRRAEIGAAARRIMPAPLSGIVLIARGSSDHAAIYGRYLLEIASGRPVSLAAPSLHTLYNAPVDYTGYLAVAVSQSGRTPEITTVLERAMSAGARGLAVTNAATSPLGDIAEEVVHLDAGEELAVPATKTFTAQLLTFALLADALRPQGPRGGALAWSDDDLEAVPGAVQTVVADSQPAERFARTIGDTDGLTFCGRGLLFAVALEGALKVKETALLPAEGYSSADLRHGPIAAVAPGTPVVLFSAPGPTAPDIAELARWLARRNAVVAEVGPEPSAQLPVPPGLPEALVTIPAAVRSQQLAYSLAIEKGLDPDSPPGLTKVTPTS